jgi:hypothetical protein
MEGFDLLQKLSLKINTHLNQIEHLLESIMECLFEIDDRLRSLQAANMRFTKERKEGMARRLMNMAEELIKSCNKYLTLIY